MYIFRNHCIFRNEGGTIMKKRFNSPTLRDGKVLVLIVLIFSGIIMSCTSLQANEKDPQAKCQPTPPDSLGPFYKPDAPIRSKVGEGYLLRGVVRSAKDCQPLPEAVIELWMASPDGKYTDEYRATVIADEKGRYTFESHVPPPYTSRPAHIHIKVTAAGHEVLVTQHYSKNDQDTAKFDLILRPDA
jgi:protocatechuate 3,4-dioxygenase beta subunit